MNFTLPVPPSINAMYRRNPHGYGLFKTKEAKEWIKQADSIIRKQRHKILKGKVDVEAYFFFKRESDIDGRVKALLDVFQSSLLIENDSQVYSLLVIKDFDKQNPRVEINIVEND